jgi:hypothetical protein
MGMDIKKIIGKLPTGFVEDAAGMDGDALRAAIIKAETSIREVEREMGQDERLSGARDIVKDIVGGYNDAKKAQRAKIAYSLHLLEERGELGRGEGVGDADAEAPGKSKGGKSKGSKRSAA